MIDWQSKPRSEFRPSIVMAIFGGAFVIASLVSAFISVVEQLTQ